MGKFITIILLFTVSSSYAMELHHAVVLDHNSSISGRDDKGRAIDGHIGEAGKEKPAFNTPNKFMAKKARTTSITDRPIKAR